MKIRPSLAWAFIVVFALAAFAFNVIAVAQVPPATEQVARQFEQGLPNVPGKTLTTVLVTFPPGARAVPHRHGAAFVYAYVLDGAVRSQLDAGPATVYRSGQDWAEAPGAHHVLTENASASAPARLLVVFIADNGAQLKTPDSTLEGNAP